MARPTRCRRICVEPAYDSFRPEGIPTGERIHMTVDEYEAIRLIDLEKRTHEQCAEQMGISRTTVTENLQTVWSMGRRFTFREEITGFAMVWMCFAAESVVEDRSFLTCNYQSGEKEKDR